MASSTSRLCLLSMFAVDGKVLSDSLTHFAVSSYNSQSQKNECIMLCRYFTSYIASIFQVHLYPTHHLLAQVV